MLRAFVSSCVLAAFVCGVSAPASASTFDRRTRFTFSQPITLPGVTLPAGTYVFRLADPTTGRKVVQVTNDTGTQSYAMLLSMPAFRPDPAKESEISFMETGAGMPSAVKTWWQEGSTLGYEFLYPREQARRLAAGLTPEPASIDARASTTELEASVEPPAAVTIDPTVEERIEAAASAEAAAVQAPQPAPVTTQEPAPAPAGPADQATVRDELPQTASFVPLAMALGTLLAFGGVFLSRRSKSKA